MNKVNFQSGVGELNNSEVRWDRGHSTSPKRVTFPDEQSGSGSGSRGRSTSRDYGERRDDSRGSRTYSPGPAFVRRIRRQRVTELPPLDRDTGRTEECSPGGTMEEFNNPTTHSHHIQVEIRYLIKVMVGVWLHLGGNVTTVGWLDIDGVSVIG